MKDLNIELTKIRFYCQKGGTKIHIVSISKSVIDFCLKESATLKDRPKACGSFETLSDDNSYLSKNCAEWVDGKWGWETKMFRVNSVYSFPFFIRHKNHYALYKNLFECDDTHTQKSNKGEWKVYVK